MLLIAAVLLLLSVVGYWDGVGLPEVVSDFRPYYLGAALLLGAAMLLGGRRLVHRHRSAALGFLVVVAINAWEIVPVAFGIARPASPGGTPVKVAAFNVEWCNTRFAEVRTWATNELPDVLMFCESTETWAGELAPLARTFTHHVRVAELTMDLFSRHPMLGFQIHSFGPQRGFCLVELQLQNQRLNVIVAHACPRIPWGEKGYRERTRLLEEGLPAVVAGLGDSVVVVGDLNVTPWAPVFSRMLRRSGLNDARVGQGLLVSRRSHALPARLLWNALDHCLVSDGVQVDRMWTGPDLGSDHRPIVAELRLVKLSSR